MIIAIAGTSGSGKSTLAKEIAKRMGLAYVPASVNEMAKLAGYEHASVEMSLSERLIFQKHVLEGFQKFLSTCGPWTVTDRSPLDVAAYTLAEIGMHSGKVIDRDMQELTVKIVSDAMKMTKKYIRHITVLRSLPTYEVIEGKRPPENPAFALHFQYLIEGLAIDLDGRTNVSLSTETGLEDRCEFLAEDIQDLMGSPSDDEQGAPRILH